MFLLPCIILLVCTISATAGTPTVVDSDGNVYGTVKIGYQVWLAQNMRVKTPKGSWCYRDKENNCKKYGALYSWAAAMALPDKCNQDDCYDLIKQPHQGICPKGFHVPSKEEFLKLYDFIGGREKAGTELKSVSGWHSGVLFSGNGTDRYGFSILPAGYRSQKKYYYEGKSSQFWTSFQDCNSKEGEFALSYAFGYGRDYAFAENMKKYVGNSLRCIEDDSLMKYDERKESKYDSINNVLIDFRDGHSYKTVNIGTQIWMAENLNYKMNSSWCYNNDEKKCQELGRLYLWRAAVNACPDGWRLPSFDDFFNLVNYIDSSTIGKKNVLERECTWSCGQLSYSAGKYLKLQTAQFDSMQVRNQIAFSAKLGGLINGGGSKISFIWLNEKASFWSTKISSFEKNPFVLQLSKENDVVDFYSVAPQTGSSIRCIKNE